MNDLIFKIINESLGTDDTVFLTEEELLNESIFFKVSPFIAFSAFKKRAFDSMVNSNSFKVAKKVVEKSNPLNAVASAEIAKEKLKSKVGSKGKEKDDTVYKLRPEQKKILVEIYNKYGEELVTEIQHFRDNVLAPYQLIKRTIKKNKVLTSKEINGLSKEEFLSARESGRKKIERREKFLESSKELEEKLDNINEAYAKAKSQYDNFASGKTNDIPQEYVEKMLKAFDVGNDSLMGYSPEEMKKTYDAIIRNKSIILRKIKYDDSDTKIDILDLLRKNRILRDKGYSVAYPDEKKDDEKKKDREKKVDEEGNEIGRRGSFSAAFANYMLRNEIKASFKKDMGNEIYRATYLSILKDNIKNLETRREDHLSNYVKIKKNIEFNKNEEKVWGKIPTNTQKYSGNIKDYYQKITDADYNDPIYFEKPKEVIEAENEIENEIKRFERKLAKMVEAEDLAKLKKYRLINNLIVVSELKDPSTLFKTREEILATSKKTKSKEYIDEEEYVRRLKHLTSIKYDTFQELSDAKEDMKELQDSVDTEISEKYNDIVTQFINRRTLQAEKLVGHKYDNAGDVMGINDIENFVNEILRKEYTDIDIMKQDKMQLDNMISKYKSEESNAAKELDEIKMILSQVDRKFQGMSIKVIGRGNQKQNENEEPGSTASEPLNPKEKEENV